MKKTFGEIGKALSPDPHWSTNLDPDSNPRIESNADPKHLLLRTKTMLDNTPEICVAQTARLCCSPRLYNILYSATIYRQSWSAQCGPDTNLDLCLELITLTYRLLSSLCQPLCFLIHNSCFLKLTEKRQRAQLDMPVTSFWRFIYNVRQSLLRLRWLQISCANYPHVLVQTDRQVHFLCLVPAVRLGLSSIKGKENEISSSDFFHHHQPFICRHSSTCIIRLIFSIFLTKNLMLSLSLPFLSFYSKLSLFDNFLA